MIMLIISKSCYTYNGIYIKRLYVFFFYFSSPFPLPSSIFNFSGYLAVISRFIQTCRTSRPNNSTYGEEKYSRSDRIRSQDNDKASGFASSHDCGRSRRCFDIDLRIGQRRRLSILMARDRDSARYEAHVVLMILVYRGIPSLAIYRRARIATYRIRVTGARCNMSRRSPRGWAT